MPPKFHSLKANQPLFPRHTHYSLEPGQKANVLNSLPGQRKKHKTKQIDDSLDKTKQIHDFLATESPNYFGCHSSAVNPTAHAEEPRCCQQLLEAADLRLEGRQGEPLLQSGAWAWGWGGGWLGVGRWGWAQIVGNGGGGGGGGVMGGGPFCREGGVHFGISSCGSHTAFS